MNREDIKLNQIMRLFDLRQLRLLRNALDYARSDAAGLPGHQLMLIISKLFNEHFAVDTLYKAIDILEDREKRG